jgi:hypothetical protein
MVTSIFEKKLSHRTDNKITGLGKLPSKDKFSIKGEKGESIIPMVFLLISASILLGSLVWLHRFFENKTREHLYEFKKNWNSLSQRYPE